MWTETRTSEAPGPARIVIDPEGKPEERDLGRYTSIGRHPGNTIQIKDPVVSKRHAEILREENGTFLLRDLGSLNGTYVRGRRVTRRALEPGDEIQVGSTRILFLGSEGERGDSRKITFTSEDTRGSIRERVSAEAPGEFLPESMITDQAALRRDYERLRIGHEISKSVATELDLRRLLPKILSTAFDLISADRAVILLTDHRGRLVPAFSRTREGEPDEEIVLSTTVLDEVKRTRAAVLSSDASTDARFSGSDSIIAQRIRSTMTVPLLHSGELLGIMHLDTLSVTHAFTQKDLLIFTGIAAEAAIAIQNARLAAEIEREAHTRSQLSRLIPPSVVEQVLKGDLTLERGGRLHEVTMLYSDIRGFTAMAEGIPPEEVMDTLNDHFEIMVEILFQHGGSLDKFVGDEIIGLFGAPVELDDAPFRAVTCAREMVRSLEEFNELRAARGQKPLRVGIGINTGEVITGAVGSKGTVQYTAIGDPMNVASRLVDLAKPDEILLSERTYRLLGDRAEADPLPPARVKGKTTELRIFRLTGLREDSTV